jgi:hypothetical protein
MLLLFWKLEGISVGPINSLRWHHKPGYPPRYFGSGDAGLTIINPYLKNPDLVSECSFALTSTKSTCSCWFDNQVLVGTQDQVYSIPWNAITSQACNIELPVDLSGSVQNSFSTASGLPSDSILQMDSCGDYLSILTSAGLYWKKSGTESFLTCLTNSGVDTFISEANNLYLAEGQSVRIKYGEPTDLSSWDDSFSVSSPINRIWVTTHQGQDVLFIATTSGLIVKENANVYDYSSVISGSLDIKVVSVEYDSHYNWGHAFTASASGVNIINLKTKQLENYMNFGNLPIMAFGHDRLYSK